MYPTKQSTAITLPFFVHDVNGDAVTGLTDGSFTKRISKNGGAFAAMTVTISEMENGWYSIPLSTSHSDTLGLLTIVFTNAGAKQVNLQFRVHARLPDDLAFPATSGRSIQVETDGMIHADIKEWLGAAPLALISQLVQGQSNQLGAQAKLDVNAEVVDGLGTDMIAELPVGLPPATPTIKQALMILYMSLRDGSESEASPGEHRIKNDAGVVIAKQTLTKTATLFTRGKLQSG